MRAIVVDDEPVMLRCFHRMAKQIECLGEVERFDDHVDVLEYAQTNTFDVAFLDIEMPEMNGMELAEKLMEQNPELLVVFVTAYDNYIKEANDLGSVFYLMKPYKQEVLEKLAKRLDKMVNPAGEKTKKDIYIHTFGRFTVFYNDRPISLTGKAKEILAYLVTKRGKEISNETLYTTIWEGRECDNYHMKVYYNALKRLKDCLEEEGVSDLLISTKRGQIINTELFDCDYYAWSDQDNTIPYDFDGEFMTEYSWGEEILAGMLMKK
ncbi:MAG: response regulator [Eubacteriales bacterium]|nr:response regulator [Eubacteriales bacterium]